MKFPRRPVSQKDTFPDDSFPVSFLKMSTYFKLCIVSTIISKYLSIYIYIYLSSYLYI